MLRTFSTRIDVNGFRGVKRLPGQPANWKVTTGYPEFELRLPKPLHLGWAAFSFDLRRAGTAADRCWLSTVSAVGRRSVELAGAKRRSGMIWIPAEAVSIRLRFDTKAEVIGIGSVTFHSIGKIESRLRMLIALLRARAGDWRSLLNFFRTMGGVMSHGGSRSLANWLVDQYFVLETIDRVPIVKAKQLNLFDDVDVAAATGFEREQVIWHTQSGSEVNDVWSAARFCIDILRANPRIRQRFPNALSAGSSGAFAQWLVTEGAELFKLSSDASAAIREALGAGLANPIRQLYFLRDDLQTAFPFALTPAGQGSFLRWLLDDGRFLPGVRVEAIWWFFVEAAEDPAGQLVQSFLFRPRWQKIFPEGVTVFGRAKFAKWLADTYGLEGDWTNPTSWPMVGTAPEQIRLAHTLRPQWQREHPDPFKDAETAEGFLRGLTTSASGLAADTVAWCSSLNRHTVARELAAGGANIIGHFCTASGLRRSVDSVRDSIRRVGLGVSLRDIWVESRDEPRHAQFNGLEFYDTTIIHTQPGPYLDAAYARTGLHPREPRTYRIGYWYWELEDIPESWTVHAAKLDELWVATEFVAGAARQRLKLPVFKLMPGVELPKFVRRPRAAFDLPENKFMFLFVFNMTSIAERKNPCGLIKAYRQAFASDPDVILIIKTSFGDLHPDIMAELHHAAAGANIIIVDAVYGEEETLSLIAASDCYISLHRSEGWGLTMAEAMLLGKPTIATAYSGNMDFMTATNSLLVDFDLVSLKRDYPPYTAGSHWAEPSIDHAAQLMRRVFENQHWATALGQTAQTELSAHLSLAAAGRRMAARLDEIRAITSTRRRQGTTVPASRIPPAEALRPSGPCR